MFEVEVPSISPARFRSVLSPQRFEAFEQGVRRARQLLAGRVVWNIDSTARGGGDYLGLIRRVLERSRVRAAA